MSRRVANETAASGSSSRTPENEPLLVSANDVESGSDALKAYASVDVLGVGQLEDDAEELDARCTLLSVMLDARPVSKQF